LSVFTLCRSGVSSQRRKSRKAYFTAPSSVRRVMMSAHLSKDLKDKYSVRAIPIRKGDQVKILRGTQKGREGKVQTVYRRRRCIYIEKIVKEKTNGQQAQIPIHPSNCTITSLKLDKDRKAILEKKKRTAASKDKHKQMSKMD
jgi:large subunit ribosomal protein L26e